MESKRGRSRSPDYHRRSEGKRNRSPDYHRRSEGRRSRSPDHHRRSEGRRNRSPDYHRRSEGRRSRSPDYHWRSEGRRSRSPDYHWRSEGRRSRSPDYHWRSEGRRSRSPDYHWRSEGRRSRSPDYHWRSEGRSRSPDHHQRSEGRSRSPDHHQRSEGRSRSPDHHQRSEGRSGDKPEHGSRYWGENNDPLARKNNNRYWNKYSREEDMVVGSRYYENEDKIHSESSNASDEHKRSDKSEKELEVEEDEKKNNSEPPKKRTADPITSRTGGAYIPPAKLKLMQASITDKASVEYQRIAWEALKKSIHGLINKVNTSNITHIIKQLFKENIIRGRGLLCRSIIQAQAVSPTFTHVYAALVALINSRFPNIGELLLTRLILQFKRGFKRNDKTICMSSTRFIAHLVNQNVAHEIIALEILTLLVETPTDYSIEVAIAFLKECGMKLTMVSKKGVDAIFEVLKNILHEGKLNQRVMYITEVLFHVRKDEFKGYEAVTESLDLVEEEDQFTHLLSLEDATDAQDFLNAFKYDPEYTENEEKFRALSKEMLGESGSSDSESGSEEDDEEESDDESEGESKEGKGEDDKQLIIDKTETNLVSLRREIYLTIYSSLGFEECAHKLMKMGLKPGQEVELCNMVLDCCCEMRSYEKFFGLLAERFCRINKMYIVPFQNMFKDSYGTVYRLKPNQLRNVAKFFAHLLFEDAISWEVLSCINLNEEDTTSSGRIFIKILFQELAENMGLRQLNERIKDPALEEAVIGLFPRNNPKNTRFSINFFTSIGLGGLTDDLREHLKAQMKAAQLAAEAEISESSSSSDSSDFSEEESSEDSSESNNYKSASESSDSSKKRSKSKRHKKKSSRRVKSKKRKHEKTKHKSKKRRR